MPGNQSKTPSRCPTNELSRLDKITFCWGFNYYNYKIENIFCPLLLYSVDKLNNPLKEGRELFLIKGRRE